MSAPVTVWRYVLRADKFNWAVVLMDSTGIFSAVSSWGNFAYGWGHHGHADFRQFFLGKDFARHPDYFAEKLRSERVYDEAKTFQHIRRRILEGRRSGWLSTEVARKEWEHFVEVAAGQHLMKWKDVSTLSEWDFRTWWEGTGLSDAAECAHYGSSPQVVGFVQNILPLLAEELRWDLMAEACARGEVAHG